MARHALVSLSDLWVGEMRPFVVTGQRIVLVRVSSGVYAYEDRCAHLGVPLSLGTLDGDRLTCSAHQWEYDVTTGRGINPRSAQLRRFPIEIDDDGVVHVVLEPAIDETTTDSVGPVLESGPVANAIVSAIRRENVDVSVQDRGSYLRISSPRRCIVTREAIERELGRPFHLPEDLELVMPAFKGMFDVDAERATWMMGPVALGRAR